MKRIYAETEVMIAGLLDKNTHKQDAEASKEFIECTMNYLNMLNHLDLDENGEIRQAIHNSLIKEFNLPNKVIGLTSGVHKETGKTDLLLFTFDIEPVPGKIYEFKFDEDDRVYIEVDE